MARHALNAVSIEQAWKHHIQLTSSDDQDRLGEGVHLRHAAQSQTLTNSDGLLAGLRNWQQHRVEATVVQEEEVGAGHVGVNEVSWRVVKRLDSGQVDGREQVGERLVALGECLQSLGLAAVAKSQWLVQVGLLEIGARVEERNERGVHAEASQNDTIGDLGIHGSQSI